MTIEERNEVLRSRLQIATERGFVIKPHHFLGRDRETDEMFGYESIIFDPDFGKALWGDKEHNEFHGKPCTNCNRYGVSGAEYCYEYYQASMVCEADRIAFLESFA